MSRPVVVWLHLRRERRLGRLDRRRRPRPSVRPVTFSMGDQSQGDQRPAEEGGGGGGGGEHRLLFVPLAH